MHGLVEEFASCQAKPRGSKLKPDSQSLSDASDRISSLSTPKTLNWPLSIGSLVVPFWDCLIGF